MAKENPDLVKDFLDKNDSLSDSVLQQKIGEQSKMENILNTTLSNLENCQTKIIDLKHSNSMMYEQLKTRVSSAEMDNFSSKLEMITVWADKISDREYYHVNTNKNYHYENYQ